MADLIAAGTRPLAAKKFLEFYTLQCENDTIKTGKCGTLCLILRGSCIVGWCITEQWILLYVQPTPTARGSIPTQEIHVRTCVLICWVLIKPQTKIMASYWKNSTDKIAGLIFLTLVWKFNQRVATRVGLAFFSVGHLRHAAKDTIHFANYDADRPKFLLDLGGKKHVASPRRFSLFHMERCNLSSQLSWSVLQTLQLQSWLQSNRGTPTSSELVAVRSLDSTHSLWPRYNRMFDCCPRVSIVHRILQSQSEF